MKGHNLVADVFIWIFSMISFILFAILQFQNDATLKLVSISVYVIPLLIATISDITDKILSKALLALSIVAVVLGSILVILSFVFISQKIPPNTFAELVSVILSSIFIIKNSYIIAMELMKYCNTQAEFRV